MAASFTRLLARKLRSRQLAEQQGAKKILPRRFKRRVTYALRNRRNLRPTLKDTCLRYPLLREYGGLAQS